MTGVAAEVEVVDENLGVPDYDARPLPDLVGISAFTSQAIAAYALATRFRRLGVPVVMGGVHATMRTEEVLQFCSWSACTIKSRFRAATKSGSIS